MNLFQSMSMNFMYTSKSNGIDVSACISPDTDTPVKKITPFQMNEIQQFKLPISYLDDSNLFPVSDVVCNDLELVKNNSSPDGKCIYDYLLKPSDEFSKLLLPNWKQWYTNDISFLSDTQDIIKQFQKEGNENIDISSNASNISCERVFEIWDTVKQDPTFMERYSYVDWDAIKDLNKSSTFLQFMSVINIMSPLISLIIPFIFLLFPFILLKIQRIPISFASYIELLKNLAKNHFIGKAILTMEAVSWEKILYLCFTAGLYMLQIYQNINSCSRYYRNIQKINNGILDLRTYIVKSVHAIDSFLSISTNCSSYMLFCNNAIRQRESLQLLLNDLNKIKPFENTFENFSQTGELMRCFYQLYNNPQYEECIRYSMGFNGYIENLRGICSNIENSGICFAEFDISGNSEFIKQYYPPLINENPVKNTCKLDKNMIISAPNKAGKTTILKTSAINIIISQQIGGGFYDSATINPYTHIHSYLNIPDTSERDSLFQAESRRCKDIIDIINENNDTSKHRHFCIFDELYSGTNPTEAAQAGKAFLKYLSGYSNVSFMLTTHYLSICKHLNRSSSIQNYKMDVNVLDDGNYEYKYKLKKGISRIKGAIRVLKDLEYPSEILNDIEMSN